MKKLRILTLFLIAVTAAISCSDDSNGQSDSFAKTNETYELTTEDYLEVLESTRLDMVSFVEDVSEFYTVGDSYEDFKNALDPVNGLSEMHPAADDLLFTAYTHIAENNDNQNLTGTKMLIALQVMVENAQNNGIEYIADINFEEESVNLWGSSVESLAKKDCKWYQIGCHFGNFWRWLNRKPGNGGQTNLQMVGTLFGILVAILAYADSQSD